MAWKASYFRSHPDHHLEARLTILYREPGPKIAEIRPFCELRGLFSALSAAVLCALCVSRFWQFAICGKSTQSAMQFRQPNLAPMVADRPHNIKRHGQRATAIFQVNKWPSAHLHRIQK